MRKLLLFLFILLSLSLNTLLSYEILFNTSFPESQKNISSPRDTKDQIGLARRHTGALISGAFLLSYLNKVYLVDTNGNLLKTWTFSSSARPQSARLLKNNTILFLDTITQSFKISDQNSQITWEMSWESGAKYNLHPHFWTIDDNENIFLTAGRSVKCPDIQRYSQNKKITWSFTVPLEFCRTDDFSKNTFRGIRLRHIFYIPKFYLSEKPALAVSTASHAFILDIKTKKILWKYHSNNNEVMVFKVYRDGKTAGIIENKTHAGFIAASKFNLEKDKFPQKWVTLASFHRRPDFFDLGSDHIIFTDGDVRLFELSLNEQDKIGQVFWSLFLNFESPFFRSLGFDFIPTVPIFDVKQNI